MALSQYHRWQYRVKNIAVRQNSNALLEFWKPLYLSQALLNLIGRRKFPRQVLRKLFGENVVRNPHRFGLPPLSHPLGLVQNLSNLA